MCNQFNLVNNLGKHNMNNFQTPTILKQAREKLGLSQASVSRETGINRSYLSRFESGVQLLSDANLQALQDHYATTGFDFSSAADTTDDEQQLNDYGNPEVLRESVTILDGFQIPEDLLAVDAEELLTELERNEEYIRSQLITTPKIGLFGVDQDDLIHKLMLIGLHGLRCYSIVQELQGKEQVFSKLNGDTEIDLSIKRDNLQAYLTEEEQS